MTIYGKIAGIGAGLGGGLFVGVVLAALNPLIPDADGTTLRAAPTGVIGNIEQDDAPAGFAILENGIRAIKPLPRPVAGPAGGMPTTDTRIPNGVKAGRVGLINLPAETRISPVAVPGSENQTKPGGAGTPDLPVIAGDPTPDVSTDPAKPLEMAEPRAKIGADAPPEPDVGGTVSVTTPRADAGAKVVVPKPLEPALNDGIALVEKPANPNRPPKKRPFDTSASHLKTSGTAGFGNLVDPSRDAALSGIGQAEQGAGAGNALRNALLDFSEPFQKTGKPVMSIILLDVGDAGLSLNVLRNLSLPVTFAFRADDSGAAARSEVLRAAGFEVLAMMPRSKNLQLSGKLSAAAVSERVDRILAVVPQAVGLIDQPAATFQKNRNLAKAVIARLRPTGHGLVTYFKGFNTVPQTAKQAGLAAGSVQRVLDGKGEAGAVILRYLDRAVLDARRAGHVIVLGTTSKTTVATLVNWALGAKARGVALAPVSAILRQSLE